MVGLRPVMRGLAGMAIWSAAGLVLAAPAVSGQFAQTMRPTTAAKAQPVTQAPVSMVKRSLCVWDMMGQNGEIFAMMRDYQVKAASMGVDFELKPYVEEKIASEDFRVKYCDAVIMTGLRVRPFNAFTGSIEAIAAIPTDEHMRKLITVLSAPGSARYMQTDFDGQKYEVAGILPFGTAYAFVNDRKIDTVEEVNGKKIAIFDHDKAQAQLTKNLGALSDPSDVTNFSGKFNNGKVDIVIAPLIAYRALELYRGMGKNGGVIDFNLAQVSLQVLIHPERFPAGFGQKSREYLASMYDKQLKMIQNHYHEIADKDWVHITDANRDRYQNMARDARIRMIKDGIYDAKMMSLLRKIRCQMSPALAECSLSGE